MPTTVGSLITVASSNSFKYDADVEALATGEFVISYYDPAVSRYLISTFSGLGISYGNDEVAGTTGSIEMEMLALDDGSLVTAYWNASTTNIRATVGTQYTGYTSPFLDVTDVSVDLGYGGGGTDDNIFLAAGSDGNGYNVGGTFNVSYAGGTHTGTLAYANYGDYDDPSTYNLGSSTMGRPRADGYVYTARNYVDGAIYLSKYEPPTSSDLKVTTYGNYGDVAQLTDDAVAVVWENDGSSRLSIYNQDLSPRALNITIRSNSNPIASTPDVVALADGRLLVVWSDTPVSTPGMTRVDRIVGKVFEADGTSSGNAFVIDQKTVPLADPLGMTNPVVSELPDGRVVVTYRVATGDQQSDIVARFLDPRQMGVEVDGTEYADLHIGTQWDDILAGDGENDTLQGGGGDDLLLGGEADDKLDGGDDDDRLYGGTGIDLMRGGRGNDVYRMDHREDQVIENNNEGIDRIESTVGVSLKGTYVERVNLVGTAAANITGNSLANGLVGNAARNIIDGQTGLDVLTGGAGTDFFRFSTALGAANVDHITDLNAVDDTMQLKASVFTGLPVGTLPTAAFRQLGTGTVDDTDRILYNKATGQLFFDRDGSATHYSPIEFAVLDNKPTLNAGDFVVY